MTADPPRRPVRAALFAAVLGALLMWVGGTAVAGERVALVIGNAGYAGAGFPALRNPVNDARDIADALERLGFEVVRGIDVDLTGFNEAVEAWGRALKDARIGLFYYAGHGFQYQEHNYLVPLHTELRGEIEIRQKTVAVEDILDRYQALTTRDRAMILVLDACRTPPPVMSRGGQRGWAEIKAPRGTYIAFATAPGSAASDGQASGRNGLFTHHLLQQIRRPGLDVNDIFVNVADGVSRESGDAQDPWVQHDMKRRLVLCDERYCSDAGTAQDRPQPAAAAAADRCSGPNPPIDCLFRPK